MVAEQSRICRTVNPPKIDFPPRAWNGAITSPTGQRQHDAVT
jgi:hypothetical protein